MAHGIFTDGLAAGRLEADTYTENFGDLHPPLTAHEAAVAADRCYFCYDAPCITACPTDIDIPMFIRQISTGNPLGSAKTIFDQNILGGMCARVCPTETLCEQACVREVAEGKPVEIGRLQRYATDVAMADDVQFYTRAASTGKRVAVVGAGPAGLACAHRLSLHGHDVTVFDARPKPGGLNEYGIATYKTVDGFAQREVDYILGLGGIELRAGEMLGRDMTLGELTEDFDAVFLGIGLGGVNALNVAEEMIPGVEDAVEFIASLRQSASFSDVPVGRRVVVIGGGMTAIDAAVQAKLLGAEQVTICYRRGREHMNASRYEQDLAAAKGVTLRHWMQPEAVVKGEDGAVVGMTFAYTTVGTNGLEKTGETVTIPADQVLKAIGQTLRDNDFGNGSSNIALERGRVIVDAEGRTSLARVWAGGDCTGKGEDLTVTAVAQGRDAAESIHRALSA